MVAATSLRYFQQASALGLSSASAPSVESVEELTCPTTEIQFMGLTLRQPTVIPVCWLAGLIGIIGFFQLRKTRVTGSFSYSISFLMFGIMMLDASVGDCILPLSAFESTTGLIIFLLDVGLTSSIAVSFMFNGLIDVGLIKETVTSTKVLMLLSYLSLFVAWYVALVKSWDLAFQVLYEDVIAIACGIYVITEAIYILRNNAKGLGWLISGGTCGAVGLFLMKDDSLGFCELFSPWFNGMFWWFLLSDAAMYCMFYYFLVNKGILSKRRFYFPTADMESLKNTYYLSSL